DGRGLLLGFADEVKLYDLATKKFTRSFAAPGTSALVCSPGGRHLATMIPAGPMLLPMYTRLWDFKTAKEVHPPRPGTEHSVSGLAFSADGRTLAGASNWYGFVHVWDVATGRRRQTFALDKSLHYDIAIV